MKIRLIVFSLLFAYISIVQSCWTEHNLQGMVQDARRLTPENLQWVIDNYNDSFIKGLKTRCVKLETRQEYIESILNDSQSAVKAFTSDMSYVKGAEYLGRLARTISEMHKMLPDKSDLNNPNWQTDYAIFLQKKRDYFRIRWKGIEHRPKSRNELEKMLVKSNVKVDQVSKILTDTLNKENKPIESYDVRSAPFGVGSIAYSNAVNTIALTWLYVWDLTGGVS